MKHAKGLALSLIIVSLFSSFAVKPKTSSSNFCAQWLSFCNAGGVNVEYASIDKFPVYQEIYDLTPSNCDNTGPTLWGGSTYGWFEVHVKLAAGQTGSIKAYEGSTEILCEPTTSNRLSYNFDIPISGCLEYTILVSTDSCD